jgi:hypothetical protein
MEMVLFVYLFRWEDRIGMDLREIGWGCRLDFTGSG